MLLPLNTKFNIYSAPIITQPVINEGSFLPLRITLHLLEGTKNLWKQLYIIGINNIPGESTPYKIETS